MHSLAECLPTIITRALRLLRGTVRRAVKLLGAFALLMVVLAFTSIPWRMHRWLGTAAGTCPNDAPEMVVVLGGSGMPSGPELLRLDHAAAIAVAHPNCAVVVMHPLDSAVVERMVAELLLRGVAPARITTVMEGTNTRGQALALLERIPGSQRTGMALVTAPENAYRSVHAFRKVGFDPVCGAPAWDTPMYVGLGYDPRALGGRLLVPDVGHNAALRYDFWNRLKLQVTCLREGVAILYYTVNGWM